MVTRYSHLNYHATPCLQVGDKALRKLRSKINTVQSLLEAHKLVAADDLSDRLAQLQRKQALSQAVQIAQKEAKAAQTLIMQVSRTLPSNAASAHEQRRLVFHQPFPSYASNEQSRA